MNEILILLLLFAGPIVLLVWLFKVVKKTVAPRTDSSLGAHVGALAVHWSLWGMGVLAYLALYPMLNPRSEASRHAECRDHLRTIAVAMNAYHDAHGCFPPAYSTDAHGSPLHSWRTLLLPFLEEKELYIQLRLDEPWDSPHNQSILKQRKSPSVFRCPSTLDDPTMTNYVMVVGPDTFSDGPHGRRVDDITDGPSNTIMVVEVTDSFIHWAEPRDLDFRTMSFKINDPAGTSIRSNHPGMALAVFGDGAVHPLPDDISPELLRGLITVAGGEDVEGFFTDR